MESVAVWQSVALCGFFSWIAFASYINITHKVRSLLQPWAAHHVVAGAPLILRIQSGHGKLARQMTLLMAFCDYLGNCLKDVVSAPRPSCPPVRRIIATKDEEENAMEYGLPSSHTLNTVCLSGYLVYYIRSYAENISAPYEFAGFSLVCLLVVLIGLGRIYLGMHSPIDIIFGLVFGLMILLFWLNVHEYVDDFITMGQNGSRGTANIPSVSP